VAARGLTKVVPQVVDGSYLVDLAIRVPCVKGDAVVGSGELVEIGALQPDVAEAEGVVDLAVDVDGHLDLALSVVVVGVGCVGLVPEELPAPEEGPSGLGLVAVDVAGLVHPKG
jgi:hypothetical protein